MELITTMKETRKTLIAKLEQIAKERDDVDGNDVIAIIHEANNTAHDSLSPDDKEAIDQQCDNLMNGTQRINSRARLGVAGALEVLAALGQLDLEAK